MNILVSICNQPKTPQLVLGLLDPATERFRWLDIQTGENTSGATGLARRNGKVYVGFQGDVGVLRVYDEATFELIAENTLKAAADLHSITFLDDSRFLVVSTATDEIYECTLDGDEVVAEELFWRFPGTDPELGDQRHVNSVVIDDGGIFASYCFSEKDERKNDADGMGGIVDTATDQVVVENLAFPHSLVSSGGYLYICSVPQPGKLVRVGLPLTGGSDERDEIEIGGFLRGLCFAEGRLWLGSSAPRWQSKSTGKVTRVKYPTFRSHGASIAKVDPESFEVEGRVDLMGIAMEIYDLMAVETPMDCSRTLDTDPAIERIFRLEHQLLMVDADAREREAAQADAGGLQPAPQPAVRRPVQWRNTDGWADLLAREDGTVSEGQGESVVTESNELAPELDSVPASNGSPGRAAQYARRAWRLLPAGMRTRLRPAVRRALEAMDE